MRAASIGATDFILSHEAEFDTPRFFSFGLLLKTLPRVQLSGKTTYGTMAFIDLRVLKYSLKKIALSSVWENIP